MTQAGKHDPYLDPANLTHLDDPWPHYARMREVTPRQVELRGVNTTLVARYADCVTVFRDVAHFSSLPRTMPGSEHLDLFGGAPLMTFTDPPLHDRLRQIVNRHFLPASIRTMRPRVLELVNQLLDRVAGLSEFDLVETFTQRLPLMVVIGFMGAPPEDYPRFKTWSLAQLDLDQMEPGGPPPAVVVKARAEQRAYAAQLVEQRRRRPLDEDVMSAIIRAYDTKQLNDNELFPMIFGIIQAGDETTANTLSNAIHTLLINPEQLALLRAKPALISGAVEEAMRYCSSLQLMPRFAMAGAEIGGVRLDAGEPALILMAAANRDPAKFANPDQFDITRHPNEHLGFGEGIHFCIGAHLSRLELAVAIATLLERFPRLRLADPQARPAYKGSSMVRGVAELRVRID
jgi:cytochrome P450